MLKFLHAADIHLDSPLRGLEKYDGAPVDTLRQATRQALIRLVRLAIDERVAFVLLAGDLYDGDWKDYNTGLFLVDQMMRLKDANIPVFLIAGNHDAANRMTKMLRLPTNVQQLATDRAETARLPEHGIAIHGQGFATQAVTEDLAAHYPPADPGCFNIGLLHTSAEGHKGHDRYAPCTLDTLRRKGYQYWALGHVHKRMVLHDDPFIVFPGNIQGRHIGETGIKGCTLVTLDDRNVPTIEHVPLDVLRWELCRVDASELSQPLDVLDRFTARLSAMIQAADGRFLALRVVVHGACTAHAKLAAQPRHWEHEIRAQAISEGSGKIWVEKVHFETTLPHDTQTTVDGPLKEFFASIRELETDETRLHALLAELDDLRRKLPTELTEGEERLSFDTPEGARRLLEEVRQLLVLQLGAEGASR